MMRSFLTQRPLDYFGPKAMPREKYPPVDQGGRKTWQDHTGSKTMPRRNTGKICQYVNNDTRQISTNCKIYLQCTMHLCILLALQSIKLIQTKCLLENWKYAQAFLILRESVGTFSIISPLVACVHSQKTRSKHSTMTQPK
jgi:hypothetical protein